jgi:hypothetical protein
MSSQPPIAWQVCLNTLGLTDRFNLNFQQQLTDYGVTACDIDAAGIEVCDVLHDVCSKRDSGINFQTSNPRFIQ